ncbi:amino acid ABC transporter permease [Magnetospirillum molischianum]|uniref:GltJ protein n=1 Tax=Magnetospirillum molischianum DSM 120 TaxID=1150626 RepID=H8FPE7_MAGML|nr:amino acid ABC transporter permease [Magnetospirillum molischianum]CCG40235.1 GltJ protein [Magnetospirillum molischianum DSM 120]
MGFSVDFAGVLSGAPLHWLLTGFLTTIVVTIAASLVASLLAVILLGLRISESRAARVGAAGLIELFRNTPFLVQMMFWYFAAFGLLPTGIRDWINAEHSWATFPGNIPLVSPEFIASTWGLGIFSAVFIAEEIRAGLLALPKGQSEAAQSQGFGHWASLRFILLPQALTNSFQSVVGQYLNLMKLSSLATAIGLAEITYQVRQIESYNSHAIEAFAVGTSLYLLLGLAMGRLMLAFAPKRRDGRNETGAGNAA